MRYHSCPGRSAARRLLRRGALQSRGRTKRGVWYGPGSAERHEECRTASGTRDSLPRTRGALNGYELLPAVRADLLRRLGRRDAAREAYVAATAATKLEPLRRLYARRLGELG